jgi:FkbM family methyltransferase
MLREERTGKFICMEWKRKFIKCLFLLGIIGGFVVTFCTGNMRDDRFILASLKVTSYHNFDNIRFNSIGEDHNRSSSNTNSNLHKSEISEAKSCLDRKNANDENMKDESNLSQNLKSPSKYNIGDEDLDLESRYEIWMEQYLAPKSSDQAFCMKFLKRLKGSAQFKQDIFLFHNFFKYWPMNGKKGFYIESGANSARFLSNTFAFDRCLGWSGLCIEPNPAYHKELAKERSCKIIPQCVSDSKKKIQFVMSKARGHVALPHEEKLNHSVEVNCSTLEQILQENEISEKIDFWILDIEGHELEALRGANFKTRNISSILVENNHISGEPLEKIMSQNGFTKISQLRIDGYYVHKTESNLKSIWIP